MPTETVSECRACGTPTTLSKLCKRCKREYKQAKKTLRWWERILNDKEGRMRYGKTTRQVQTGYTR